MKLLVSRLRKEFCITRSDCSCTVGVNFGSVYAFQLYVNENFPGSRTLELNN